MDDDLYDEFGNYIGGDSDDESVENGYVADQISLPQNEEDDIRPVEPMEEDGAGAIVLHEDKQIYPSARDVFPSDVETVVHERDTQPLSVPIVEPEKNYRFTIEDKDLPNVTYSRDYQAYMMGLPEQARNVALVGHIHHGKTSLVDAMVKQTHDISDKTGKKQDEQLRYTDTHILERERGISIMASPISLVLPSSKGKSHLIGLVDAPGHVDFADEVEISGRLADGFAIVVDAVEGMLIGTKLAIQHALRQEIPFFLVVNKVDRLILELRLPPEDAYFKLLHCIETVNEYIRYVSPASNVRLSPELGNVVFASASMEWCFSLYSFARKYCQQYPALDVESFGKRLWGNVFYEPESRKFTKTTRNGGVRSFIYFILDPVYKLYTHTISEEKEPLEKTLAKLGIRLKAPVYKLDVRPLLKIVCREFFGPLTAFVDACLQCIPSPVERCKQFMERYYTGGLEGTLVDELSKCDPEGPLMVYIAKMYNNADATEFYALARVISGTLRRGQDVQVLGETFSPADQEDAFDERVEELWIPSTRYRVPIDAVPAGNWALIKGLDAKISKTATVVSADADLDNYHIIKPLKHLSKAVVKVAVEPLNPSELPKMLEGIRKVGKCYALLENKVEESGEHILLGSGELFMDCVLHDLRTIFAQIEIKVSDPVTRFTETCIETSSIKCYSMSANRKNKLTILAEPLDEGIAEDIESSTLNPNWPKKQMGQYLQDNYGWDILAARSIWAFGPDDHGTNLLLNDTLPTQVDKKLLNSIKESVKQGFKWSTREGPLCEEPIRNTRFRLIDATIATTPIQRGGGQIIAATRKACYSSFLLASPRLLEPVYSCHITCPKQSVSIIYNLLTRRRGAVISDTPIPGTPLYSVLGEVPVIDSFGFETDLRVATKGQAFASLTFEKWSTVPGDPLDADQKTKPLQAAQSLELARDFVLKTRRRKGLSEEPTITKFLDPDLIENLKETGFLD
ncbi:pre-mRNA-splicing factor Snu114p [Trichomonascus vanleenenianus]|uniref:116 kDa U5 small nuclear ribonucleoprotein component n=1 Tax=Trichomonascus vanleenenianus TaxID=2268995 RepID=UPI003ECA3C50